MALNQPQTPTHKIAQVIFRDMRPWLLDQGVPPNSCVLMTRLCIDMLSRIGVKAEPMACITTAVNGPVANYLRKNDFKWPKSRMDKLALAALGGFVCQVGGTPELAIERSGSKDAVVFDPKRKGYEAHLVALTEDGSLIDASLDQVNYMIEKHNESRVSPITWELPNIVAEIEAGEGSLIGATMPLELGDGGMIIYEGIESPVPLETVGDWVIEEDERDSWDEFITHFMP